MYKSTGISLILVSVFALTACLGEKDPSLTWEDFKSLIHQEPDTGIYIVNGDEIIETDIELHHFYDDLLVEQDTLKSKIPEGIGLIRQPLAINRTSGRDDRWNSATARNLTYCISSSSFGSRYSAVVNAMDVATTDWEAIREFFNAHRALRR